MLKQSNVPRSSSFFSPPFQVPKKWKVRSGWMQHKNKSAPFPSRQRHTHNSATAWPILPKFGPGLVVTKIWGIEVGGVEMTMMIISFFSAFNLLVKNNSSGNFFFFDHLPVPLNCMYLLCTQGRCNMSLIGDLVRLRAQKHKPTMASAVSPRARQKLFYAPYCIV